MKRLRRRGRHQSLKVGSIVIGASLAVLFAACLTVFAPVLSLVSSFDSKRFIADDSAEYVSQFPKFFGFLKELSPKLVPEHFPSILSLRHELLAFERLEPLENLYPKRPYPAEELPSLSDIALDQHALTFTSVPGTQETGIWKVSATQNSGPRDAIHFRAIPLLPGQSIILGPGDDSEDSVLGAWDLRNLSLNFINFGATPDRLDAPGKLLLEILGPGNLSAAEKALAPKAELGEGSKPQAALAESSTQQLGESNNARDLNSTAFGPVVEVSHVPSPKTVDLKELLFENSATLTSDRAPQNTQKVRRLKLTWSKNSSGVLLLMGSIRRPSVAEARDSSKGFLYLTVNELRWDQPLLPKANAALQELQNLGQSSGLQTFHEVWHSSTPAGTSSEEIGPKLNSLSHIPKHNSARAQTPNQSIGTIAQSKKLDLRADILLTDSSMPSDEQEINAVPRSVMQLTLHSDSAGRIQNETLQKLASLVASGAFVQLNFKWRTDSLSNYSRATVFDMFSNLRWAEIRSNTMFRTNQDLALLRDREIFGRIDSTLESAINLLSQPHAAPPEILLQVCRQPTESKRSIAQLTEEVPQSFAPGYAQYLAPLSPSAMPKKTTQESFKPITHESLLDWVASEQSRSQDIEEIYTRATAAKTPLANKGFEKGNGLKVLAQSRSLDGTLIVFDQGWTFIPSGYKTPGQLNQSITKQGNEPTFGVSLDKVTEAKTLVFEVMTQTKSTRIHFLLPPLAERDERIAKGYKVELRSEFPITSCSSSESGAKFERLFGQFDGTMQVSYESANAPSSETEVTCIVDLSQKNPIPKKKHDKQERALERAESASHEKKEKEPVVTFSLKVSIDGKKLSLDDIQVGPYLEPAALVSSSSSAVQFDLLKDIRRLISLTSLSGNGSDLVGQPHVGLGKVALWFSPSTELNPNHATSETWQKEVSSFLDERAKLAEKLRNEKL